MMCRAVIDGDRQVTYQKLEKLMCTAQRGEFS